MERKEILKRFEYAVPERKKKRVIISSDIKNEADDQFAVAHHLLTPCFEIKGIIAAHSEWLARIMPLITAAHGEPNNKYQNIFPPRKASMMRSYDEGRKLLELMQIDDVPLLKGSICEIEDVNNLPDSEGADLIIKEASKDDAKPLYVVCLGCLTDLAVALLKAPGIAERMTIIWIGGGDYPNGADEFNLKQDIIAARVVFQSPVKLWQIPLNVYKGVEVSLAELVYNVKPCGKIGAYLCEQLFELNTLMDFETPSDFPHGESWCLGDSPTITALLQNAQRVCWHIEKAPIINDDCTYSSNSEGKDIRVYDSVDTRLTLNDFYAKLALAYKG